MNLTGMKKNEIIPYNPILRKFARDLRKISTLGEILLWKQINKRKLGVQFHRQIPVNEYILDFYCHELRLAIEVDGSSHDNLKQKERDRIWDYKQQQLGIKLIHIDDSDVKRNLDSVITFLKHKIGLILTEK